MDDSVSKIKITQKEFDELYEIEKDSSIIPTEKTKEEVKVKTFDDVVKKGDQELEEKLDEEEYDEVIEYDV